MNKEHLRQVIERYTENFDHINDKDHDEIFKWKAIQKFREVWFSDDYDSSFAELFKAAKSECSVLIDNSHVSPTNGIIKLAEERPEEVEYLFREVLLHDDGGNINVRQDNMEAFLHEIEKLRQEVFPENWKYKQERHAVSCYLFFVNPEENYIYRYSDAEEFAKHMEFGMDIGSGDSFKLETYYKMCDEIVAELKEHEDLLQKHFALIDSDKSYYRDESLHLLAFDLMYCARSYNFYDGITYRPKKVVVQNSKLEQIREQENQAKREQIESINRQIRDLELSLEKVAVISLLGVKVTQNKYGSGTIIMQDKNKIKVQFESCEKAFILSKKYPVRPSFADDQEIIEAFTLYGDLVEQIEKLEKELKRISV